jgi:hypothetical protein
MVYGTLPIGRHVTRSPSTGLSPRQGEIMRDSATSSLCAHHTSSCVDVNVSCKSNYE